MSVWKAALVAAAGLMALSGGAMAATAVAVDPVHNKFAWKASMSVEEAEKDAVMACEAMSGGKCLVFSSCGLPGEAAIAFNKATGNWGTSCGSESKAAAEEHALETCELRSQSSGSCEIVERYSDALPDRGIAHSYFKHKWAENCEQDKHWITFATVNAKEVRLQDCTAAGCTDEQKVFRPRGGENVFFWPTDNTRLFKRGPDLLQMTQINSKYYKRCDP